MAYLEAGAKKGESVVARERWRREFPRVARERTTPQNTSLGGVMQGCSRYPYGLMLDAVRARKGVTNCSVLGLGCC